MTQKNFRSGGGAGVSSISYHHKSYEGKVQTNDVFTFSNGNQLQHQHNFLVLSLKKIKISAIMFFF